MISLPDYYMDLVRGLDPLHKRIEFSAESDIVAVASVGLWPVAAAVNVLAAASVLNVSSSDVKDDAAGVGARTMLIEGIDANYAEISETVIMDGQTRITTANSYLRINACTVLTAGAELDNAGIIYLYTGTATAGVPDDMTKLYAALAAGANRSSNTIYTVPAGKYAVVYNLTFSGYNTTAAATLTIDLYRREYGVLAIRKNYAFFGHEGSNLQIGLPFVLPEKCDLYVQAMGSAAGPSSARVAADIIQKK